jgi:hypothetical protein
MKGDAEDAAVFVYETNRDALARNALSLWTVYDHPADCPRNFIARRFEVASGQPVVTDDVVIGELATIRRCMEHCGLVRLNRSLTDDSKIIETWI